MSPTAFPGFNITFAKEQQPYRPLHAHRSPGADGCATSCWRMTIGERLRVLFTGRIWVQQLTFRQPLQPQRVSVERPILEDGIG